MKKAFFFFAALVLGSAAFLYIRSESRVGVEKNIPAQPDVHISIKGTPFKAIVRDTPATRAQGLSGRKSFKENEAMLFAFPTEGLWGIWMKDMRFSIDILWLGADRRVSHIEKNVSPETYPNIFFPKSEGLYVIELNSGIADRIGVTLDDEIVFVQQPPVGK